MSDSKHFEAEDLFLLAFPPAGEPRALPEHLSTCPACARRFAEWSRAARELAEAPDGAPADFERRVMAQIRSLRTPGRHRGVRRGWAALAAAAVLALALWLGVRGRRPAPASEVSSDELASPEDRRDDALLRDVSRLISGEEDSSWKDWTPLPASEGGRS